MSETGDSGTPVAYDRVAGVVVTGNEDGAHHVISEINGALGDIGFTIPGQAWVYWNMGPGPGPSYSDTAHGHQYVHRFEEWKRCGAGRPCDYSGPSYAVLRDGNGIQWPDGTSRLYSDGVFGTATDDCETYGHDLATGVPVGAEAHRELAPAGRAILKTTDYSPAPSEPDDEYPFLLTTGRTVHHFHTRTKTGRADRLARAAPRAWVEISRVDAARLELSDGERVLIETPRGSLELPVRLGPIAERTLFIPFHYGNSRPGDAGWQAPTSSPRRPGTRCRSSRCSRVAPLG